jgi:hypothetical protein
MARGERLVLSGLLLADCSQLVLRMDDGGQWRLESIRLHGKLLGKRVTVAGTRDGFDLIAVSRIDPA